MKLILAFALLIMTVVVLTHAEFIFYYGLDSNDGDIKDIPGQTVAQLKIYCDSDPNCVGFNTNEWVKDAMKPQSQWY